MAHPIEKVRHNQLLKELSAEELKILSAIVSEKSLPENATIFVENMHGEALYIILDGVVKVSKMVEEGEEKTLSILNNGDILGEMALLGGGPRLITARAMKSTRLLTIKRGDFQNLLEKEPKVCIKFFNGLVNLFSQRLNQADSKIKELLLYPSSPRQRH